MGAYTPLRQPDLDLLDHSLNWGLQSGGIHLGTGQSASQPIELLYTDWRPTGTAWERALRTGNQTWIC